MGKREYESSGFIQGCLVLPQKKEERERQDSSMGYLWDPRSYIFGINSNLSGSLERRRLYAISVKRFAFKERSDPSLSRTHH